MAKEIGFSRAIKPFWIQKTAEILNKTNFDFNQMNIELNEYLRYEINSATNLRKTVNILNNFFLNSFDDDINNIKKVTEEIISEEFSNLPIYWSLMILSYPVFNDIVSFIGKVFVIQDEFSTKWIIERMYEEWGERSTLKYSIEKILQTLVSMDILYRIKPGIYTLKKHKIDGNFNKKLIVSTVLKSNKSEFQSLDEINNSLNMFPFKMNIDYEWVYFQEDFRLIKLDDTVVLGNNSK